MKNKIPDFLEKSGISKVVNLMKQFEIRYFLAFFIQAFSLKLVFVHVQDFPF
ncbi:hypothetical protein SAMD00079811_67630 [Scytonema sp. HK-05]|nr:hypothetical protein SAMD00079811_67630 [Scytonema sp. HK-05]